MKVFRIGQFKLKYEIHFWSFFEDVGQVLQINCHKASAKHKMERIQSYKINNEWIRK